MIINKKSKTFLSSLPFSPKVNRETMKVSFSKGFIFDCYKNYFNNDAELSPPSFHFSQGPGFFQSDENEYPFDYNDFFYLDSSASIFKLTKTQREDYDYMKNRFGNYFPNYLIWKAPSNKDAGGEQVMSENIFLQDKASGQKRGFQTVIIKESETETHKRIYGGIVTVEHGHFQGFVEGLDYSEKEGENEKIFKLKIELIADIQQVPQQVLDYVNLVSGPDYIKDYEITSVSIVEYKDEEEEWATLSSPQGVYYINIGEEGVIHITGNGMSYDTYVYYPPASTNIPAYIYTTVLILV